VWTEVTRDDFANAEALDEDISGLVEQIARASGMRVALLFNEHDAGAIKVSCRTSAWAPSVDASAVMAQFGGGGHVRAAGALVSGSVAEVREAVMRAAREAQPTRTAGRPAGASSTEAGLAPLRGAIWQVPPAYAAVKVGGRPAYARARSGETVKLAAREVQVHRLEMTEWNPPDARLFIVCGRGTYVRSIARELGRGLGSAAHVAAVGRLAV